MQFKCIPAKIPVYTYHEKHKQNYRAGFIGLFCMQQR